MIAVKGETNKQVSKQISTRDDMYVILERGRRGEEGRGGRGGGRALKPEMTTILE